MKIGRLTKEQIDFFADMDPLLMLERLEFPNCFALAATETDMQTREELPAGLMICAKSRLHRHGGCGGVGLAHPFLPGPLG